MTIELSEENYPTLSIVISLIRGHQYTLKNKTTPTTAGDLFNKSAIDIVTRRSGILDFLEKYTGKYVPDQSAIRKNYVSTIYDNTISRIRSEIGDSPIWVSIDETTDVDGRYICIVIVDLLHEDNYSNPYILMCEELEKCNFKTIGKIFNDTPIMAIRSEV